MIWTEDGDEPRRLHRDIVIGEDLSKLSVAELRTRIDDLQREIERTEAIIGSKQATRNAADEVFR